MKVEKQSQKRPVVGGKFEGADFLSLELPDFTLEHKRLTLKGLRVLENTHEVKELVHGRQIISAGQKMNRDVFIIRSIGPYKYDWAEQLAAATNSRLMMFPEVHHVLETLGRTEVNNIADLLSFGDIRLRRKFPTRPQFGALKSQGIHPKGYTVAPFISMDIKPSGEKDLVFFYPIEGIYLDPNWFVMLHRKPLASPAMVHTPAPVHVMAEAVTIA
jgi:hypothetical protein